MSQRSACKLVGQHPGVYRYTPNQADDSVARNKLKSLAVEYPGYGYRMLHALLLAQGISHNKKKTYRLYCEQGLQVRTKKRKKIQRDRQPMDIPTAVNQRWSMDFVSDQLHTGRRFRVLNMVDDFSRELVGQIVSVSITGHMVARYLEQITQTRSLPKKVVCDNGPEFTGKAMHFWLEQTGVRLDFIQPGKPTQNAYVESFNGKFRDGCLNQHWFRNMKHAKEVIDQWRNHYNTQRPHSSLGYVPPQTYAKLVA